MARRHDEDELLAAAVDAALEGGLGELTFGRLAKRIGIADRTLVYYFPTKADLLEAVLGVLAGRLIAQLEAAFGEGRRPPAELLGAAFPLLTTPEADRVFALWFELAGQAAAGLEPQRTLASAMLDGWIAWLADRVEPPDDGDPRPSAIALLANLDGALLLHHLGHPEAARTAVAAIAR
ncbi:MAG: TetR/AcrR family transcriptional regulator [Actinomycetota bacterium]|nr:TetR/AcrR family transcriptional regulator [Actinomycetota bacterium]